jgi:uncharacterized repeat protein (TIGR01451 family)
MTKLSESFPHAGGSAVRLETIYPTQVRVGQSFDYQIKATNISERALQNVVVHDSIPGTFKMSSADPQVGALSENEAQWHLGTMSPDESKLISVKLMASEEGSFTSCAEVTYDSPVCVQIAVVQPQLRIAKTAPAQVLACERIPMEYVVTNTGSGAACGVTVSDDLPQGLIADGQEKIEFTIDALEAGKSRRFRAMVDPTQQGMFASKAVAHGEGVGMVESNVTTTNVLKPVLSINQSSRQQQYIGRDAGYEIRVTNEGDGIAKDAMVETSLPSGGMIENASEGGRVSGSQISWNLGTLRPDDSRTLSFNVTSAQPGSVSARSVATAYCAEDVAASASTLFAGIPAILLEVIDISDPVQVGDNETYVVSVTNQGSAVDTDIEITCELEQGMQYVSSTGPTEASVSGNVIKFRPLASIAPKAQAVWRVNVKATGTGDMRFATSLNSAMLQRAVVETESTHFYK